MIRLLLVVILLFVSSESAAQLRLIVSTGAGGGYDLLGRLVARHLGRYLPDSPSVVVENMPGASGRRATNYLAQLAPRDGTVIALVQQLTGLVQALGDAGVQYDVRQLNWLGSPVHPDEVLVVWHSAGVRSIADARTKEVTIGTSSRTGAAFMYPKLSNVFLGTQFKIILGYKDGPSINAAMERGEVLGRGANPWSEWKGSKPDWVRDGKIIPLLQMSMNSHPDLRHVPLAVSLAPDKKSQAVLDLVAVASEAGRPFVAPPGVSGQRVHLLREALKRVVQDPAFKEEAAKMMVEPALVEGIALQIGMRRVLEAPAEAVARLKEVLQ